MKTKANDLMRMLAVSYLVTYLPCDFPYPYKSPMPSIGQDRFRRVTNDHWLWLVTSKNKQPSMSFPGTTCGYLCHWMMWALVNRDPLTINRTDKEWNDGHGSLEQMGYLNSLNISRIQSNFYAKTSNGGKSFYKSTGSPVNKAAYKTWANSTSARPKMGDIVHIKTPGTNDDHVFVFLSEEVKSVNGKKTITWLTADGGQPSEAGLAYTMTDNKTGKVKTPSSYMCMNRREVTVSGSKLMVGGLNGSRELQGWIDLSAMPKFEWDLGSTSTPTVDGRVVDLLPQLYTFPNTDEGKARKAAWEAAACLAIERITFCIWEYADSWSMWDGMWLWVNQVLTSLTQILNMQTKVGLPTTSPSAPVTAEQSEAVITLARALNAEAAARREALPALVLDFKLDLDLTPDTDDAPQLDLSGIKPLV